MIESTQSSIDPRILDQLRGSCDDKDIEVILTVNPNVESSDERGTAGVVIDRVAADLQEQPRRIKYMPRLEAVYIQGSKRFVQKVLDQEEVTSASAAE